MDPLCSGCWSGLIGNNWKWLEMIEKKSFFLSLFRPFYSTIHTLGALFTIKRPQKSQIRLEIQIFYYKNASNEVVGNGWK
jgi:hypothetical protein